MGTLIEALLSMGLDKEKVNRNGLMEPDTLEIGQITYSIRRERS